MTDSNPISAITMDAVPDTPDVPSLDLLRQLQGFSGEFNWLATRTRTDLSYPVSLLASASSKQSKWSFELAKKILRFLQGTKRQGITISCTGSEDSLVSYTDAGYAGKDTRSQSGLVIVFGGSIIVWRSCRQTVSALSTAEAELHAAVLGWAITEGLRQLLMDFGIDVPTIYLMIDNAAA